MKTKTNPLFVTTASIKQVDNIITSEEEEFNKEFNKIADAFISLF